MSKHDKNHLEVLAAIIISVMFIAFSSWCVGYWIGVGFADGVESSQKNVIK